MRIIPITMQCTINHQAFVVTGTIEFSGEDGWCAANLHYDRTQVPSGFEPRLLSYVAITGYPHPTLTMGRAVNPFKSKSVDFRTTRDIDLGKHGWMKAVYYSKNRGTSAETVIFDVTGEVDLNGNIVSIAPLCEVWRPTTTSGVFSGELTFTWRLEDGRTVTGFASGSYEIHSPIELKRPQMRLITFNLQALKDGFRQSEVLKMHDLAEWEDVLQATDPDRRGAQPHVQSLSRDLS